MPYSGVTDDDESFLRDLKMLDGTLEWVVGGGSTVQLTEAEHGDWRWIPQMAMADLYEQMRVWCTSINEDHRIGTERHPSPRTSL